MRQILREELRSYICPDLSNREKLNTKQVGAGYPLRQIRQAHCKQAQGQLLLATFPPATLYVAIRAGTSSLKEGAERSRRQNK